MIHFPPDVLPKGTTKKLLQKLDAPLTGMDKSDQVAGSEKYWVVPCVPRAIACNRLLRLTLPRVDVNAATASSAGGPPAAALDLHRHQRSLALILRLPSPLLSAASSPIVVFSAHLLDFNKIDVVVYRDRRTKAPSAASVGAAATRERAAYRCGRGS